MAGLAEDSRSTLGDEPRTINMLKQTSRTGRVSNGRLKRRHYSRTVSTDVGHRSPPHNVPRPHCPFSRKLSSRCLVGTGVFDSSSYGGGGRSRKPNRLSASAGVTMSTQSAYLASPLASPDSKVVVVLFYCGTLSVRRVSCAVCRVPCAVCRIPCVLCRVQRTLYAVDVV